jgi:hypothetical protein
VPRDRQTGRYVHQWGVVAHDHGGGEFHEFARCDLCGRYMRDGRMMRAGQEPPRSAVQADTDRPFHPGGQHERVATIQTRGPVDGRLVATGVQCSCGHEIVEPVRDGGIEPAEARVVEREAEHHVEIVAVLR